MGCDCYSTSPQNHLSLSPSTGIKNTTVPCLVPYMGAGHPNSVPNSFTTVSIEPFPYTLDIF